MPIAIIGAGTMGADIAQVFALGGNDVILHDLEERKLHHALARISRGIDKAVSVQKTDPLDARRARRAFTITTKLDRCAAAGLVIEAVPDDRAEKQRLMKALDGVVRRETIVATTTNTLSVTSLAAETQHPERVIGLHFCRPAHIMRLVEVVRCDNTPQDVIDRVLDLIRDSSKTPLLLSDIPGLVVNRISQAYYGEALRLLDDGGLDAQTVDQLMEAEGFPMGPFRLIDYLGVETVLNVTQTLYEANFYASSYRPHPRLRRMVDARRFGRKSGNRFYSDEL